MKMLFLHECRSWIFLRTGEPGKVGGRGQGRGEYLLSVLEVAWFFAAILDISEFKSSGYFLILISFFCECFRCKCTCLWILETFANIIFWSICSKTVGYIQRERVICIQWTFTTSCHGIQEIPYETNIKLNLKNYSRVQKRTTTQKCWKALFIRGVIPALFMHKSI